MRPVILAARIAGGTFLLVVVVVLVVVGLASWLPPFVALGVFFSILFPTAFFVIWYWEARWAREARARDNPPVLDGAREDLIAQCSWHSGWCVDEGHDELGQLLRDVAQQMRDDR